MSRGPYPILLMLAMSLPGAARALGLGEIRVDSALNEPLSAQIDIVGATRDDLIALTAKVANREIFQRFGAERPSFLSSATFKVGIDAQGRPVLNIRSVEAFTDPVINFLVELRWANGALVRDYSLLLDPAGFSPASRALAAANATAGARMTEAASTTTTVTAEGAAPVAAKPVTRPVTAAGQAQAGDGHQHRVAGRDTLRAIARRAGARSETQAQRMMIAIFRANAHAFDGNINRLHSGALLRIPSATEAQAVDTAEAKHEYRAHMTSWRLDGRPAVQRRLAASPVTSQPVTSQPIADAIPATLPKPAATGVPAVDAPVGSAKEALTGRVHSLEKELDDMHRQLEQLTTRAAALSAAAAEAPASQQPVGAPVSREPVHTQPSREPSGSMLATAAAAELPVSQPIRVEVMRAPTPQAAAGTGDAAPAPAPAGSSRFMLLGVLAGALTLLLGGAAFVRRRLSNGRSRPPQIPAVEDYGRTLNVEPTPCPPAPHAPVYPEAPAVAHATATAKLIAPEPVADAADVMEHAGSEQTTQSLAIDVEALERSYLDMDVDSLGIDSVVEDTAAHDTTTLDPAMIETVVLDRSQ
ncbi:MAG: hypothetical protein M3O41_20375, partial [Pseudomonadota bacterium]|nr:hypothetical protein [Pseudomonadota bacterium]